MQVGVDPFSATIALLALLLTLWERYRRHQREQVKVRARIDLDPEEELSIWVEVVNRESAPVYPEAFTFYSGADHHSWALELLPAAHQGIASGRHWRHHLPFHGDPTDPYRWTLRLQDGRTFTGGDHQVALGLQRGWKARWRRVRRLMRQWR